MLAIFVDPNISKASFFIRISGAQIHQFSRPRSEGISNGLTDIGSYGRTDGTSKCSKMHQINRCFLSNNPASCNLKTTTVRCGKLPPFFFVQLLNWDILVVFMGMKFGRFLLGRRKIPPATSPRIPAFSSNFRPLLPDCFSTMPKSSCDICGGVRRFELGSKKKNTDPKKPTFLAPDVFSNPWKRRFLWNFHHFWGPAVSFSGVHPLVFS